MCFICGELAGYIQDYTKEQMLMVEEIQLKKISADTLVLYFLQIFNIGYTR